ncbi:WXG100 family type VII secretion target [Brachybacterium phenoliresistens]|uniref:WXG100 family type VII secretion target n=1 Tax=Brachybacterium phenoliresistens TaxID=396014 RepID=Z9JNL5_9MICO|nr:hypothetical protein [Brachybacterium phenoliresistens]EWS79568.1 hypothetical protein BF93_13000 [Brachybacterium phenoliresistens]
MTFYGMDTAQGEDFASLLASRRETLAASMDDLSTRVEGIGAAWVGPDHDAFLEQWRALRSGPIDQAISRLMDLARDIADQAQDQDIASAADGWDALGERLRDIFRFDDDGLSWRDFLPGPNDGEDWLGLGLSGILDGLGGALTGFTKYVMNPRTLATLFTAGGDDLMNAFRGAAGSASRLSRVLGPVGAVVTGGFAGWDRWEQDASDPSLSTGERVTRAVIDGGANAAGGGLGAWGGAAGGAAIGTMICPGVGTVIGGAVGGIIGGLAGSSAGNAIADFFLG